MTIDESYKIVSYLVDKYQGTYISPEDFNMIMNMAQTQYLEKIMEDTGNINSNNPDTPRGEMKSNAISDKLSKFHIEAVLSVTSSLASKPVNNYTITSIRTTANKAIKRIFDDSIPAYVNNPIDSPTATDPLYIEVGDAIKFYPTGLASPSFAPIVSYVREPAKMVWAYYVDDNGNMIHLPVGINPPSGKTAVPTTGSVNPEWPDADMYNIILAAVGIIGINLKDADLMRSSQIVKNII
jgi:hypothetical protein